MEVSIGKLWCYKLEQETIFYKFTGINTNERITGVLNYQDFVDAV